MFLKSFSFFELFFIFSGFNTFTAFICLLLFSQLEIEQIVCFEFQLFSFFSGDAETAI